MKAIIIHGKRISEQSPRDGREAECELAGVTRANAKFWNGTLKNWTEWWDVHPLVESGKFAGIPERRPESWLWMRSQDGSRPIYLQAPEDHSATADKGLAAERFAMVPGAVRYNLRAVMEKLKLPDGREETMFGCMVGHMIAHILCREQHDTIILNGIGMVDNIPYEHLHRQIYYWMGYARGRGVNVVVEGNSCYKQPNSVYAYDNKFGYEEYEKALKDIKQSQKEAEWTGMHEANREAAKRGRPAKFGRSAFR